MTDKLSGTLAKTALVPARDLLPRGRRHPLIIAMALAAGGTAKTSTTTILGTILALRGYIVRIFDLDPQCNSSEICGRREEHREPEQKTVWDLIQGLCTLDEATVPARYRTGYDDDGNPLFKEVPNLFVVHGDSQLTDTDTLLANKPQKFNWFYNLTGQYTKGDMEAQDREVWLLDLPANYGKLTVSALIAMTEDDEVIPPLLVTGKESGALEKLLKELLAMQREFSGDMAPATPTVKHVLLCATPTSSHNAQEYHDTVEEVERDYPGMVLPYVRHSGVTAKQYRRQVTPPISDPKSAPSVDYEKVADALGFPDLEPAEG
ncbi:ParA family protein [Streptomyces griseofuscus]|uniref:ParA family protein n=1 Tax=Streptomyces griseofuscus TaxID=146922 RepID=UPI0033CCFB4A